MSDEIEQEIAKQNAAGQRQYAWQAWARSFGGAGFSAIRESILRPADCPHHDLLVNFSSRAISAGLGEERFVLRGPDDKLYAAQLCPWLQGVSGRKFTWSERREIRRCNARMVSEGRRAIQLKLHGDYWATDGVRVEWLVLDQKYLVYSRDWNKWDTREAFVHVCATALRTTRRSGR